MNHTSENQNKNDEYRNPYFACMLKFIIFSPSDAEGDEFFFIKFN